jgi:hypothetical protein
VPLPAEAVPPPQPGSTSPRGAAGRRGGDRSGLRRAAETEGWCGWRGGRTALLLDADGLNASGRLDSARPAPTVLTPHPGELALLGTDVGDPDRRLSAARGAARRANAVVSEGRGRSSRRPTARRGSTAPATRAWPPVAVATCSPASSARGSRRATSRPSRPRFRYSCTARPATWRWRGWVAPQSLPAS